MNSFHYFSIKLYVLGAHWNRQREAIRMSTHNICFHGDFSQIVD